jgi:hypothetical protein
VWVQHPSGWLPFPGSGGERSDGRTSFPSISFLTPIFFFPILPSSLFANDIDGRYDSCVVVESAQRTIPHLPDRGTTLAKAASARRRQRRLNLCMGVVAASALCALMRPVLATAQEVNMSTTVASLGAGTATSLIKVDSVRPKPATDRGLALPSATMTNDGSHLRVRNLVLELPDLDLGEIAVASRLGDQPLPAVFRAAPLASSALASPMRALTFTTTGTAPLSLSFGQMGTVPATGTPAPGLPALAAAALSFTPNTHLSVTPQMLIPIGSPDAQTSVGTAIQANVVGNLALLTDVGVVGTADTAWAPLASARLVGQWPRVGIETSVLRGAAAPRTETDTAFVSSRDREAAQAQLQPLPGLTLAALTSSSRPAADPDADDTTLGSLRIAYDGLPTGQVAALRQRETTASRESEITSLEWRQRGLGSMAVRYVQRRASDSAADAVDEASSRVEMDLPALAPRCAGRLDLRAGLTAGSSSLTGPGVNSRVSGRVGLIGDAALTGETELGLTSGDGQVLRALRVTTDMPVVPAMRLQLSYSYRAFAQFHLGQVFEARILRRLNLGW